MGLPNTPSCTPPHYPFQCHHMIPLSTTPLMFSKWHPYSHTLNSGLCTPLLTMFGLTPSPTMAAPLVAPPPCHNHKPPSSTPSTSSVPSFSSPRTCSFMHHSSSLFHLTFHLPSHPIIMCSSIQHTYLVFMATTRPWRRCGTTIWQEESNRSQRWMSGHRKEWKEVEPKH